MKKDLPINTDENGRDENGRFTDGNKGKPKGATNKTTRDVREFITKFLNDKAFEIPHIWDSLEDKEKATLYLHLCRLVLPKPQEDEQDKPEVRPTIINLGSGINPEGNRPIIVFSDGDENPEDETLTKEQIDKLIDKL